MKNKLLLGLGICLMGFLMACDDSSSASSENNGTTPSTQTNTAQGDEFTLKDSYKYTVSYSVEEQQCESELDITDVEFKFGPGNAVKATTKDASGTETVSGVYSKDSEDGEEVYLMQFNVEGETYNFVYSPGEEGYFVLVYGQDRVTLVHAQAHVEELMNHCGEW